ncbi:hypothetical protein QNI19_18000 [Cytophagaceae bacterium DM2B3-1]|uniref:Nucleotidyltransferase domain-containing protein n=1 Tax=Xanthocytophaga flava TaxID=3048013 RepID=A0ABT7CM59_9BACT|nr:hypothetical protein [Xanthocytophaga flavus]MDJ1467327.1 hypothetical protein [Xanthocytophaga flavus]MDJ1494838.1 hypothetical protein [Xanthocytophaga flavus]
MKTIIEQLVEDPNILNLYHFGSYVYGTRQPTSDMDYIAICHQLPEYGTLYDQDLVCVHFITLTNFQLLLSNCDIQALECFYLNPKYILKASATLHFELNKEALRRSISTIASNSFVKGKKKLIVQGDYNKWLAIKSVFHSLRILDFGIQIANSGKIEDYSSLNWLLADLIKLSENKEAVELWELIDQKYRELYNSKSSEFRKLCPINKQENIILNKKDKSVMIGKTKIDFHSDGDVMESVMQLLKELDINFTIHRK